ncbi:pilus assembly protein TadG-related protein [Streptomyces sp. NBC_01429]|uniref:pilus assembly protein TadG-related protein n=1 Tax=Streptomyces sp. NBC_01429 TaxID=2903862 RepID=UPI002E2D16E7|nr:pilus assembly protein TadG-related protein [Streptomyces sp. NBC_01429]
MNSSRESGQAAPIYITMVAGLLFLALAFFAVGQAGATRNGAQSAADAAALAAAQESRDLFSEDFLGGLLNPGFLEDIFNGDRIGTADGCSAAARFADENKADLDNTAGRRGCSFTGNRWGFTVNVVTQKPMGANILPGTEKKHAKAHATAIVEPRCTFKPAEKEEEEEPPADGEDPEDVKPASPGLLTCGGKDWEIDPDHLDLLPDMADLFLVRLARD